MAEGDNKQAMTIWKPVPTDPPTEVVEAHFGDFSVRYSICAGEHRYSVWHLHTHATFYYGVKRTDAQVEQIVHAFKVALGAAWEAGNKA